MTCKICRKPFPEHLEGELQAHESCLRRMVNYQTSEHIIRGSLVDNFHPAFELWLEDRKIVPITNMRLDFTGQPMRAKLTLELVLVNTDIEIVDGKVRIILRELRP